MSKTIKNLLITSTVKLFNLFHKTNTYHQDKPKILLVCTTALGDNIWSTPFFKSIKTTLPQAQISYLTSNLGAAVSENNPYIDQLFNADKLSKFKLYKSLDKQKFEAIFIFHASDRYVFPLCALLKPQYLVGIKNEAKKLDSLFTHLINGNGDHPVHIRNRMLEIINLSFNLKLLELVLYPQPTHFESAKQYLLKKNLNDKFIIGIHPGSSQVRKQWPTEKFKQLIEILHQKYPDYIFLITGSKKEQNLLNQFKSLNPNIVCMDESFDILTLTAILSFINLYITNDTGPMHIASAMKVAIVAISKLDNNTWPYNDSPKAIITCGEKLRQPIPKDTAEYIHRVEVQDILNATEQLLNKISNK
ncbi:MAG: lipopolysaccharide heptosyltransferase family protein [Gammaproteobacteria bacterium]|nr:MAG: lipopolysaccharide heptosyltransferase family protein [Gammaproteobacteria bacterium]UTW41615.1 glycosyltransferase family 9 protein [bacterium SCSIO 12844]